jgi:hypothetical protein
MFEQLFFRSDALTRQLSAPLVDERRQYLLQCLAQGMARRTLRVKARLLLSITEYLGLAERTTISSCDRLRNDARFFALSSPRQITSLFPRCPIRLRPKC